MKIYELTGFFKNKNFNFEIIEYPVISYTYDKVIEYDCGGYTCEGSVNILDVFETGLLESNLPQICIKTINENKLKEYKKDIINKIKNNL